MKVINIDINESNMVKINDEKYFIYSDEKKSKLLPTMCPHRGGPLHYGKINKEGRIVCPWHNNTYTKCRLEKKTIPTISINGAISAIVEKTAFVETWFEVLPVSKSIGK